METPASPLMPALRVVAGLDVEHGGDAPAVLGPEAAGEQFGAGDHVGVEDAEQPAQVEGVEDGESVQQDQVLVGGAAADVEGAGEVGGGDDAREHLDGAEDVRLGEAGEHLQLAPGDDARGDARLRLEARPLALGVAGAAHLDPLHLHRRPAGEPQLHAAALAAPQPDLRLRGREADALRPHPPPPRRHPLEAEGARRVAGPRPQLRPLRAEQPHRGARHRRPPRIEHAAGDDAPALLRARRPREPQQETAEEERRPEAAGVSGCCGHLGSRCRAGRCARRAGARVPCTPGAGGRVHGGNREQGTGDRDSLQRRRRALTRPSHNAGRGGARHAEVRAALPRLRGRVAALRPPGGAPRTPARGPREGCAPGGARPGGRCARGSPHLGSVVCSPSARAARPRASGARPDQQFSRSKTPT